MGLFNRRRTAVVTREPAVAGQRDAYVPAAGRGYGRNVVRGLFTLLGVAVAGLLIWLAHYPNIHHTGGFWGAMGLLAGAGLALGLSQLFGGWTKWGMPKISLGVLLIGWLPAAIATGWILLTVQPAGGWQHGRLTSWSDSIGILGFVHNIGVFPAAIALAFGVVTAFIFDTTGPRVRRTVAEPAVADEDVHDYRDERAPATAVPAGNAPGTTTGAPVREAPAETTVTDRTTTRGTVEPRVPDER
jgi:hypothetical protein